MAGWSERLDVHSDAFGELPWSGAHTVNVVQRDLGVQILCSLKNRNTGRKAYNMLAFIDHDIAY